MILIFMLPLFFLFLCWGSFLNVVGYRIIRPNTNLWGRSRCDHCNHTLAWFDLIPIISFGICAGRCRYCNAPISPLYPLIELMTALLFSLLFILVPLRYFFSYMLFFSSLLVTVRTDLEQMVISSFVTLYAIPLPFLLALFSCIPVSFAESVSGAISGYLFLFSIGKLFFWWTGKEGIGAGDFELLSFIGAWIGLIGCWMAVTIGSIVGVLYGFFTQMQAQEIASEPIKIPFGPCLAIGAIIYVFCMPYIQMVL